MSEPGATSPAQSSAPLLDARQLELRIASRTLWQGLDLQLFDGDSLAVTGPSGSGKTLLLRTLARLEPMATGTVLLKGRSSSDWSMPEYRARTVYVSQKPVFREGRVQDVIEAPFRMRIRRGASPPISDIRAHLSTLKRPESLLSQPTEHLSGGEAQIVALLRAIAIEPHILILDEPTASLDAATTACVESLVAGWLEGGRPRASIWTSHDADQLARVCNRNIAVGASGET